LKASTDGSEILNNAPGRVVHGVSIYKERNNVKVYGVMKRRQTLQ
jgi:hypothetical protein